MTISPREVPRGSSLTAQHAYAKGYPRNFFSGGDEPEAHGLPRTLALKAFRKLAENSPSWKIRDMPPTPIVVLEIDDNTPPHEPPFSRDVSMWSFGDDLNIGTRTGAQVFRNLHEAVDASRFRGYPLNAARGTLKLFDALVDPSEVSWLTGAELGNDRHWLPKDHPENEVLRTLRMLFATVDVVASYFGSDRVRLVFAFV